MMELIFDSDDWYGRPLIRGYLKHWDRSRYGGDYRSKFFFRVHWEVKEKNPNVVHLHVESPTIEDGKFLNDIKHRLIKSILKSNLEELATLGGLPKLTEGVNARKVNFIESNRSTGVYKISLTNIENPKNLIETVHNVLGSRLNKIINTFSVELDTLFPEK